MKMPGFTADKSLYETKRQYRTAQPNSTAGDQSSHSVLPQAWCTFGGIKIWCYRPEDEVNITNAVKASLGIV